ncbi:phosphofurin acidic cluster sorting protein 2-like isoform X2 [Rhopilema esculentum]|uniref:phosphofurin acidic cluster sorting protein 2-like isoform X2 n=1 Tax=Rhopilema esculentum TaxID=499914 RepID=UPI0031D353E8
MAEKLPKPRPMNLFSQWEVEGTSSSCVPRVCTLRIVRMEVSRALEQDLTELVISVSMRGSRRSLRSDCIPLQQSGPIDVELDFAFSLQYPHFLKRRGNLLRVMLQRKKKYKGRTMLGYKTLAVGQVDMAQVLQGYAPNNLQLYIKEEKAPVATLTLASLSSQSVDQEVSGRRESGHENLSSTDEDADDDLSGSEAEFSAGEMEEARVFDPRDPRDMIRRKASRTFKKKFMDAIFRRLKANQEAYGDDITDELYADPIEPIEDDNQIDFLYDEDEDSDADEMLGDSFSIGSNQRPKLRPYFDQISRNESSQTLTHEKADDKASPRSGREMESGDDSKELSPSSDSDQQKDVQPKARNDLLVTQQPLLQPGSERTSPFRSVANRSLSFKERREPTESTDRQQLKRKSSLDFDALSQFSVQPLSDQMLAALSADDNIPEKVFLISIKDSIGQILAMKLMNRIERLICTTNDNEVSSVIATVASKLQKYCNKHSASPPPMKICVIGPECYVSAVLRSYVDSFSLKSPEFQGYVRFLIVPLGYHRLAKYLASKDSCYHSVFMDQFWRNYSEQPSKRDEDYDEVERRIQYYTKSASSLLTLPVAEALITHKAGKTSEGESSQACVPFVMEVRVNRPATETEYEEPTTTQSLPRDIPAPGPTNSNASSNLSSSPNSRESSMEKSMAPPQGQWGSPMQNETLDLQVDYWTAGSMNQPNKKDERKEQNKSSIKTAFRSLAVTRFPSSENDDPNVLFLTAQTKARNKVVMRLKKTKDKDTESKSIINASVNKIVCTSKSHSQTFNVTVDGADWCGIKFFSLSSQWPTHVKNFPIGIFGTL